MKQLLDFFVQKHLLASLVTILVFLLGLSSLQTINKDLYPRVKLNEVYITTQYPGASPEDVEQNVTRKIEKEIRSVTGIDHSTSLSMEDLSLITIRIDDALPEKKVVEVVTEIRDAVGRVYDLPANVGGRPRVERINTGLIPVIGIGLHSDSLSYDSLRSIAKWMEREFEQLPQIARVNSTGIEDKEVRIELDPKKLTRYALSADEVIQVLQARAVQNSVGATRSKEEQKSVVMYETFGSPEELGKLIIRSSFDGPAIRLKKVATIHESFEEKNAQMRMNGKNVIHFSILKKESADIIKSVDAIKAKIAELEPTLPASVTVETASDMSRYVTTSFEVVRNNGIIGFILVFIILALFLNPKVAFWVAMGIPVSLLGVIFLLPLFNVTLDVITLASMILVLGIIVDDAIVISERIYQRWESGEPPLRAAALGVSDVFWPVVTTVVSTLLAFLPMFLIPGDMGKFIFVIPLTVALALTISMIEGIIALPSHVASGLKKKKKESQKPSESGFYRKIKGIFEKMLAFFLRFRYLLLVLFVAVFLGTIAIATETMAVDMFPSRGAEEFAIHLTTPQGTSLEQTARQVEQVEELIASLPKGEVMSYTTTVGDPAMGRSSMNSATITIDLTPFSSRGRDANEIAEELRQRSKDLKGFTQIIVDVTESGPNAESPIALQVVGTNDSIRTKLAEDISQKLKETEGVFNVENNNRDKTEELVLSVNRERLPRYGLSEGEIYLQLRRFFNGEVVTQRQEGDDLIRYRVTLPERYRENPRKILSTKIINRNQRQIALSRLLTVKNRESTILFPHYNGMRSIFVEANVDKEVVTAPAVITQIEEEFSMTDYPGCRLIIEGSARRTQESTSDLIRTFIFAAIGIYILLVLLFDSLFQPLLVLIAVPFGVVGVLLVFMGHGEPFSFMGALGTIGLSGVVVNDSLVLVDHLNSMRKKEPERNIWQLIAAGTADRLRAIILTTITTVGGILPLAYGIGGADPMNAPMALSLGWGLLFATPLTLVLVPCLYGVYMDVKGVFVRKA